MLYKVTARTAQDQLLVEAANITKAVDLVKTRTGWGPAAITRIEECEDVRTVLRACEADPEMQLEALLTALPNVLALHPELMRDLVRTLVQLNTGASEVFIQTISKEA